MRISILMPTYNGAKFLREAIDSVFSQHHQDWELIISDDNSTDGTREYVSGLRDPRVKLHLQPTNLNIFGNLNFIFGQATGEISQILCQDDYLTDPDALHRLQEEWAGLPAEVAFLRANHSADANSRLSRYEGVCLPSTIAPERSDLFFFIFGCIPGNLSNVSVRTEAVKHAGWFRTDLPYAGDFEFWSRLGQRRPWAIRRTRVTHIRAHSGQASGNLNSKGELLPQIRVILNSLYLNLIRMGYSPAKLRLMATLNYISQHRDRGIRLYIKGRGSEYLHRVSSDFDSSDFAFNPLMGWMIFFASLGGRAFQISVATKLLNQAPHVPGL